MRPLHNLSKLGVFTKVSIRKYAGKHPEPFKPPHMNELPIPEGRWDIWYKKKQRKFSIILLLGISWFGFSAYMMIHSGSFYLNAFPPGRPGPPVDPPDHPDYSLPNLPLPPC